MNFKQGQIVMNFYRKKMHPWGLQEFRGDYFRCRAASDYEIKLYEMIGKEVVSFGEINKLPVSKRTFVYKIENMWKSRETVTIPMRLTAYQINKMQRTKNEKGFATMTDSFEYLLERSNPEAIEGYLREIKEIHSLKGDIKKVIDDLKRIERLIN